MNSSDFPHPELPPSSGSLPFDPAAFLQLYDQYAPTLLGVITAIVHDKTEAARLLEVTFTTVRSQLGQPRPASQSLFVWLLSIARTTALESVKSQNRLSLPVLQRTSTGNVISNNPISNSTRPLVAKVQTLASSSTNELINAILFRNCTPEEAASSVGMPVATARQQLRMALQQLRTPKAE